MTQTRYAAIKGTDGFGVFDIVAVEWITPTGMSEESAKTRAADLNFMNGAQWSMAELRKISWRRVYGALLDEHWEAARDALWAHLRTYGPGPEGRKWWNQAVYTLNAVVRAEQIVKDRKRDMWAARSAGFREHYGINHVR